MEAMGSRKVVTLFVFAGLVSLLLWQWPLLLRAEEQGDFHVFKISHLPVEEVVKMLEPQFPSLKFTPVPQNNTILVSGPEEDVRRLRGVIPYVDIATPQIKIQGKIMEMSQQALKELGIELGGVSWSYVESQTGKPSSGQQSSPVPFQSFGRSSAIIPATLTLLQEKKEATLTEEVTLTLLQGKGGTLAFGTRFFVPAYPPVTFPSVVQVIDSGLRFSVRARVLGDKKIKLELSPLSATVTGTTPQGFPVMTAGEMKTEVTVKDGETLAIGGVQASRTASSERKVPGVSEVPLAGEAFKKKEKIASLRSFVFLVTATVLPPAP